MLVTDPPSQTIDVGRLNVAYIDSGSGKPLILVHGGESDRRMFLPLLPHLGDGIRAISYDQRDSGDTVNPDDPYTMTDLGDDLASFIEQLGVERAHVLGTSFGGAVAMHAALDHPDRVAGVVLVATVPSARDMFGKIDEITAMDADQRRELMYDQLFTPEGRAADPNLVELGRRALVERPKEHTTRRMTAAREHHVTDRLASMAVPTLVIHGTADLLAPLSGAEAVAQAVPGAVLRTIEGGRHGITTEFTAEIAAIVREFLDVEASGASATGGRSS
jgi:pimeloyl-ACP methyl ester carboxylesterase